LGLGFTRHMALQDKLCEQSNDMMTLVATLFADSVFTCAAAPAKEHVIAATWAYLGTVARGSGICGVGNDSC
jgi:hypothetical protein